MSLVTIGKRDYKVLRQVDFLDTGTYVDGEWVAPVVKEVVIRANIQPSTLSYRTRMLPSGDSEREAIALYSNDWLHVAQSGDTTRKADIVIYRGAEWEVVVAKPYGNFGQHCEALALKVDDSLTLMTEGIIGRID